MNTYLISWSDANGYHESEFSNYEWAMEFMAELEGNCSGMSFSNLRDPDDAREEQWYDEQ